MATNDRCDGAGPHTPGEVRKYPIRGGGNAILCRACVDRENRFRQHMRCKAHDIKVFSDQPWPTLAIYE